MTGAVLEPATLDGAARLAMAQDRAGVVQRARSRYRAPWWLSSDPYQVASMQLREPALLVPFARLQESCELALGRSVRVEEFLTPEKLLAELVARKC